MNSLQKYIKRSIVEDWNVVDGAEIDLSTWNEILGFMAGIGLELRLPKGDEDVAWFCWSDDAVDLLRAWVVEAVRPSVTDGILMRAIIDSIDYDKLRDEVIESAEDLLAERQKLYKAKCREMAVEVFGGGVKKSIE